MLWGGQRDAISYAAHKTGIGHYDKSDAHTHSTVCNLSRQFLSTMIISKVHHKLSAAAQQALEEAGGTHLAT